MAAGVLCPNITSSFEKPKTNTSLLSMSTTSMPSPKASERIVVSSSPPKPAPSTTTRIFMSIVPLHVIVLGPRSYGSRVLSEHGRKETVDHLQLIGFGHPRQRREVAFQIDFRPAAKRRVRVEKSGPV